VAIAATASHSVNTYLDPRILQIVAIFVRNFNQRLDAPNVLLLHLACIREKCELEQRGDECIALDLHKEHGTDANGALEAQKTQRNRLWVFRVFENLTERRKHGTPRTFKHRLDVLDVVGLEEGGFVLKLCQDQLLEFETVVRGTEYKANQQSLTNHMLYAVPYL
jgi:hypothetical protein